MDLLNQLGNSTQQFLRESFERVACPVGHVAGGMAMGGIIGAAAAGVGAVPGVIGGALGGSAAAWKNCGKKGPRISTHHQTKHSLTSPSSEFARKTLEKASSKETLSAAETQAFGHIIQSGAPKVTSLATAQLAMPQVRTAIQKPHSKV